MHLFFVLFHASLIFNYLTLAYSVNSFFQVESYRLPLMFSSTTVTVRTSTILTFTLIISSLCTNIVLKPEQMQIYIKFSVAFDWPTEEREIGKLNESFRSIEVIYCKHHNSILFSKRYHIHDSISNKKKEFWTVSVSKYAFYLNYLVINSVRNVSHVLRC